MDDGLRREIGRLATMKISELKACYRDLFGEESPSGNRQHIYRRVAWRLQAKANGGLSGQAQDRARLLADDAALRLRAPRQFWQELSSAPEPAFGRDPRLPPVDTTVTRIYRGTPITVRILKEGFEYNGKQYTSLSAVAHRATGTRWNGFAFFRLAGSSAA